MLWVERISLGAVAVGILPSAARASEPSGSGTPADTASDANASADNVVVRGLPGDPLRAPKDPTVAGAVLSRDETASPGVRPAELLRTQLGIQVSESGGAAAPATASVRGATAAQLPVYLAGVSLNEDVAGTADLSRIPLWLVNRVEVYRGGAPIEADRLGIGGAIFFEPRWPRRSEAGAGVTLGSFGTRETWAFASVAQQGSAVLAGFGVQAATNDYPFRNDHGTLLAPGPTSVDVMSNADTTTYDGWILGHFRVGTRTSIDAFANATTREQGVPTLALVPTREARGQFDRWVSGVRAVVALNAAESAQLEARSSVSIARSIYEDPLSELALLTTRLSLTGARLDQRIALRVHPTDDLTLQGAVDMEEETLARSDAQGSEQSAHLFASRVAVAARQWLASNLSMQAFGALECNAAKLGGSASCGDVTPTGRVGAMWSERQWEVFANFGRYLRPPTLGELYGMSVIVRGNPALVPESAVTADVGVRWRPRARGRTLAPWGTVDAFARWSTDLVAFVRSSEGYVEPFNVDSARVSGVEAQVGTGLLPWLRTDVTTTLLDPRNTTPSRLVNTILPFQSRLVGAARLTVDCPVLGAEPLSRVRAELRGLYESSRFADAAGLAVIPDQTSVELEVAAFLHRDAWAVRVRAADLLDTPHFDIVGFPLPGRSFFVSAEVIE
jgi:iron complex outermembrane receptor protein